jgi:hypothetical protein
VVLGLRACKALRGSGEASREVGLDGGEPVWPVPVRATAGTSCSGRTPTNSCSGGAESERESTFVASGDFIGTGAGAWGRALRRALACQNRLNTCVFSSALVQTLAEQPNVQILPKTLCKVSSLSLGLSSLCEFQVKIWSGVGDMVAPSQVCLDCSAQEKHMSNHVKWFWFGFKFFQGMPWVFRCHFVNWTMLIWCLQLSEHM